MDNRTDLEIIAEIKKYRNVDDNLTVIIERHSGIYLDMVNAYSTEDSPFINRRELIQDKELKIYEAIIKYDETKGAKFSTYLGNETKWMCLNTYNKNRRKPLITVDYIENLSDGQDLREDTISDTVEKDLFNKVLNIINAHPDKRVEKIFEMRYINGSKNKVMPWKNIGKAMNLSIQGCINIHNSAVSHVRHQLKGELEN